MVSGNTRVAKKHETYTIVMLGRKQAAIRSLIDDIVSFASKPKNVIKVFNSSFGYWQANKLLNPRKLESVILPAGVSEAIVSDMRKFLASGSWYREIGIPWHRGYLFYGIPGSGKSSLVVAVAGELGLNLYLLNLSGMDDEKLGSLMADVQPGSIILMEDVDCTAPDREKKDKGVTLSGLLNCIDGVQSREGCMVFMTSNYRQKLDSALIRPGRVDVSVEFGFATAEQSERLRDRISNAAPIPDHTGKTMADIQQELLGTIGFTSHI